MERPYETPARNEKGGRQKGGGVNSNFSRFVRRSQEDRESGQALVEYALILMLIAFIAFGALEAIGTSVADVLSDAAAGFGGA